MAGAKAATADVVWPFTSLKFDDSKYRSVDLPHDWAIEDGFYPEENGGQGFRKRGWGYYRKRFFVPASWKGKGADFPDFSEEEGPIMPTTSGAAYADSVQDKLFAESGKGILASL